jgi:regulatory protein YycI of two-component signal transduction system YycFG
MEQNPFAQSQTKNQPPIHDNKKVYISILIIVVLFLSVVFVVRQFGEQRNRRIKEEMIQRLGEQQDVSVSKKLEMINRVNQGDNNLPTEQETAEARATKEELIKRLK